MTLTLISSIPFNELKEKIVNTFSDLKQNEDIQRPHTYKLKHKIEPYLLEIKGSFFKLTST